MIQEKEDVASYDFDTYAVASLTVEALVKTDYPVSDAFKDYYKQEIYPNIRDEINRGRVKDELSSFGISEESDACAEK